MDNQSSHDVERTDNYGAYQDKIYREGLRGHLPVVTTNPNGLQAQFKSSIPSKPYNFISGGAGEGATMDANRQAFRQWKIVPRMLIPTTEKSLKVELFGKTYGSSSVMYMEV